MTWLVFPAAQTRSHPWALAALTLLAGCQDTPGEQRPAPNTTATDATPPGTGSGDANRPGDAPPTGIDAATPADPSGPNPDSGNPGPDAEVGEGAAEDADTGLPADDYGAGARYALLGYATVGEGTHGGSGDPDPVTIHSGAELQAAIDQKADDEPLTIFVRGRITHDDWRIQIKDLSRLSILGLGDDAELDGVALDLQRAHDVIIRNLTVHHVAEGGGDAIRLTDNTHHVWIDHCTLYSDLNHGKDHYDGLVDINHAADFITLSWNELRDHFKVSLIGHSDGNGDEDRGTLHVTYHHNLWRNLSSRLPSVRFGTVHVFDNLYQRITGEGDRAGTAVSSRMGACVRLENNLFDEVRVAVMTDQSDEPGGVQLLGNVFGGAEVDGSPPCTLSPPYRYTEALEPAADLGDSLPPHAGVGRLEDPARFVVLDALESPAVQDSVVDAARRSVPPQSRALKRSASALASTMLSSMEQ